METPPLLSLPPPACPVLTVQQQGRITVHLLHRHGNTDLTVVAKRLAGRHTDVLPALCSSVGGSRVCCDQEVALSVNMEKS